MPKIAKELTDAAPTVSPKHETASRVRLHTERVLDFAGVKGLIQLSAHPGDLGRADTNCCCCS